MKMVNWFFFLRIYFYDWLFNWKFKVELLWLMGVDLYDNEKIKYFGLLIYEVRKKRVLFILMFE